MVDLKETLVPLLRIVDPRSPTSDSVPGVGDETYRPWRPRHLALWGRLSLCPARYFGRSTPRELIGGYT